MAKIAAIAVLLSAVLALSLGADDLRAVRVEQGPKLDGSLDDPAWQAAPAFGSFRMADPVPGGEPSERTELRIVYDGASLYIGIRCLDGEPSRIVAHSMAHDGGAGNGGQYGWGMQPSLGTGNDDVVRVLIDPFLALAGDWQRRCRARADRPLPCPRWGLATTMSCAC
jgi:hypothetical protein